MKRKQGVRKGRRVDPGKYDEDRDCAILAMRGRSTRAIMEETGLSAGQITYRLTLFEIKRADYRNGTSDFARSVDRETQQLAEQALIRHLRRHVRL